MVDTVRTETELLENLFQDGQPNDSITPGDVRDFIVSTKYLNKLGWDFHLDGTYLTGSRRTILAGVRTKVTIDGTLEDIGHPAPSHSAEHFWNTTTNKIVMATNEFAIVRIAFAASSPVASTNRVELELDVGGTAGVIYQDTVVFAKGAGTAQWFNVMMPLFIGSDFATNGGEIYLTPESDAEFWEFAITVARVYSPAP